MSHNKPGSNPHPIELVEHISCPVLGNYGAEDRRINAHLDELVKAMVAYKKDFEMRIYPHAAHAFFKEQFPLSSSKLLLLPGFGRRDPPLPCLSPFKKQTFY